MDRTMLVRGLRNMTLAPCQDAADAIEQLERENRELLEALKAARGLLNQWGSEVSDDAHAAAMERADAAISRTEAEHNRLHFGCDEACATTGCNGSCDE